MKVKQPVSFYANTEDNLHCFQAVLKMVLKYFLPDQDFSWPRLDKMTARKSNLWTWPTAGALSLYKLGFSIVDMSSFDASKFAKQGKEYLIEFSGSEIGTKQAQMSNLAQEKKLAREYVNTLGINTTTPTTSEIHHLINQGYLVTCNLNSKALYHKQGFAGHFIIILTINKDTITYHDPGLPPRPNHQADITNFTRAWEYAGKQSRNILAFKYPRPNFKNSN